MADDPKDETYSEAETAKHATATLKVMLATPHKPHKAKTGLTPMRRPNK